MAICKRQGYLALTMLIFVLFILGVANFAIHKAVLESGHPMLDALPAFYRRAGGNMSFGFEYAVLLITMLLAANGWSGAAVTYGIYSALNFCTAWLIFSGRI